MYSNLGKGSKILSINSDPMLLATNSVFYINVMKPTVEICRINW